MKKFLLLLIILFAMVFNLSAEEMQLFGNLNGYEQFMTLSAEDQYNSIINSFKGIEDTRKVGRWVARMINQYGREILPYMNKTLMDADFDHEVRGTCDITLGLHYYIFSALIDNDLLTEEERTVYTVIIKGKLKEYILKYRVIDGTVNRANRVLSQLNYDFQEKEYDDPEFLKEYYEKELGITGVVVGNYTDTYNVTPSPLAEYITD